MGSLALDAGSEGLVVSLDYASTVLVSLAAGQLQAKFGPLRTTLTACPPIFLAWLAMGLATSLPTIYISRWACLHHPQVPGGPGQRPPALLRLLCRSGRCGQEGGRRYGQF